MSCSGIDIYNPYSWVIFSGLLMGAAVTGLLRGKRPNWALFSFFLSGSLLLALLGLFIPGPDRFLDVQLLYFFLGSIAVGTGATWLWKSLGLLLFLLVSLSIIFVPLSLKSWHCFSDSAEIGRFRLLSQSGSSGTVEIEMWGEEHIFYRELTGGGIGVELQILTTDSYYFFIKERNLYRIEGGIFYLDGTSSELSDSVSRTVRKYQARIPGLELQPVSLQDFSPEPFTTYVVNLVFEDGNARVLIEPLYL